jgi:hypothetical protein
MLVLGAVVVAGLFVPVGAAAKSAEYTRLDVALELLSDGTFHVTETQRVTFSGGSFSLGHREIPLARTEGMEIAGLTEIREDGARIPYTAANLGDLAQASNRYSILTTSTNLTVYWAFEPVSLSGVRTFVLEYDVRGALRYYPEKSPPVQQIWWTAIGEELTSETPVRASTVTITLPEAVPIDDNLVIGQDGTEITANEKKSGYTQDGQVFTWTRDDIGRGDDFTVRLQFPAIIQGIDSPSWQSADDAKRANEAKAESRQAVVHLFMLGLGLALVAGGGTGVYGLWYLRGRDPHAGLVADFLPKPPDDLPPGVVGALLDERADEADVVATLIDLGRKGVVKITDVGLLGPNKIASGHDYIFELLDPNAKLTRAEQPLVKAMFGSSPKPGAKARLGDIRGRVIAAYPDVRQGLYDQLVERGLFPRSPEATRDGWRKTGLVVSIAAILAGLIGIAIEGWWAVFPAVAAVALGLVLFRIGRGMPRKTAAGAEAAANWHAFRRYLDDIEAYERVSETKQIFDSYLPYATACGRYLNTGLVRSGRRHPDEFPRSHVDERRWFVPHRRLPTNRRRQRRSARRRSSQSAQSPKGEQPRQFRYPVDEQRIIRPPQRRRRHSLDPERLLRRWRQWRLFRRWRRWLPLD